MTLSLPVTFAVLTLLPFAAAHGGSNGEAADEHEKEVLRNGKIGTIIGVFFLTLISSYLPWIITSRIKDAAKVLNVSSAIAAGVILGAAMSHLIPGANEAWTSYFALRGYTEEDKITNYPFTGLIAAATLLLLVSVDALFIAKKGGNHGHSHGHGHGHIVFEEPEPLPLATRSAPHLAPSSSSAAPETLGNIDVEKGSPAMGAAVSTTTTTVTAVTTPVAAASPAATPVLGSRQQVWDAAVYFMALSIHSIFDGLSIGAEDSLTGFYALIAAVLSHKAFDGFALGVPLYFARLSKFQTACAIVFCASMTPLGIGIGMAATHSSTVGGLLSQAIILSLSLGSFLFISLMELLPASLADGHWIAMKMLMCFVGWGLMALIAIWV